MSANIARKKYLSDRHCLLTAAAICMSAFLPATEQEGVWVSSLSPADVVFDFELGRYPVPPGGITQPGDVWGHCHDAYKFDALFPPEPFGWPYEGVVDLLDAGVPVMLPYYVGWNWEGVGGPTHVVTGYAADTDRVAYFDPNVPEWRDGNGSWSLPDFYYTWLYQEGKWVARERWTGWGIALVPTADRSYYNDVCAGLGLELGKGSEE